ncbi:hypothetical protein LshimejAT787_1502390 [Lyophyllum shimeji]|uniref:Uncharacterized protein n=1 Tax=Lyophyllum shimeji TaxID=47721 RepID=A0A9P3PW44_LYOSH|nr:hypothetical protein LshimejAT787_1502390 [Lyophyllum shimeji]
MPPGKDPGLSEDFQQWLEKLKPQYLKKTSISNAVSEQAVPEDDADLLPWVNARCREFEKEFETRIEAEATTTEGYLKKLRQQFHAYFRNYKAKVTKQFYAITAKMIRQVANAHATASGLSSSPSVAPSVSIPFFLLEAAKVTPRALFDAHFRPEVSNHVSAQRKEEAISHWQHHAGMVTHELKSRWDTLTAS